MSAIFTSIKNGVHRASRRLASDLNSHRLLWNYIYMGLFVFLALYLAVFHAETCGNTVITTTGGVVIGIFTNVVWSRSYEKKKELPNGDLKDEPKVDPSESGASD